MSSRFSSRFMLKPTWLNPGLRVSAAKCRSDVLYETVVATFPIRSVRYGPVINAAE